MGVRDEYCVSRTHWRRCSVKGHAERVTHQTQLRIEKTRERETNIRSEEL